MLWYGDYESFSYGRIAALVFEDDVNKATINLSNSSAYSNAATMEIPRKSERVPPSPTMMSSESHFFVSVILVTSSVLKYTLICKNDRSIFYLKSYHIPLKSHYTFKKFLEIIPMSHSSWSDFCTISSKETC